MAAIFCGSVYSNKLRHVVVTNLVNSIDLFKEILVGAHFSGRWRTMTEIVIASGEVVQQSLFQCRPTKITLRKVVVTTK